MATRISRQEAAQSFDAVVGTLARTREPVLVEEQGRVVAVVLGPAQFDALEWRAFLAGVEETHRRNEGSDAQEVEADIARAVDEVRAELHGRA
jgi:PHD/YefM family antitoxin component YafN of YafNO toxin-antitoxin module